MALNPSSNATMAGRIKPPSAAYPYGQAKNETSPAAADGTPYFEDRADDIFGPQQALLLAAGINPSGNPDTALNSEYVKAITEIAAGRATVYDEYSTSVANAYVVSLRTNQQGANSLFDGLNLVFTTATANTAASTIDVSEAIGQTVGTTIKDVKLPDGSDPAAGDLNGRVHLTYNLSADRFELLFVVPRGIGVDQTWQNVKSSRSKGVTYTNSTGAPISVFIEVTGDVISKLTIGGVLAIEANGTTGGSHPLQAIIPDNTTYVLTSSGTVGTWSELR